MNGTNPATQADLQKLAAGIADTIRARFAKEAGERDALLLAMREKSSAQGACIDALIANVKAATKNSDAQHARIKQLEASLAQIYAAQKRAA